MPRPKNASYKSYKLIYEALHNGPKYFKEIEDITGLHRNTLAARLRFLVSEGLIRKRKERNRVYNEIIEPLRDREGKLRIEGLKWFKHLVKTEEIRHKKRELKALLRDEIEDRRQLNKVYRFIEDFHESFDELLNFPESKEILDIIENWQEAQIDKLWWILNLNMVIILLNSQKQICPECLHFETITDSETNEIICKECGFVVADEIIPPDKRLKMILTFLESR
jgi:DNA-binding HxlR family transcriptional regulator